MFTDVFNSSRKICAPPNKQPKHNNILCANCLENQSQIVTALSEFTPSDERYFEEELKDYQLELDKRYALCVPCRTAVSFHLQEQNQEIQKTHNDNYETKTPANVDNKAPRRLNAQLHSVNYYYVSVYKLTHVISLLTAVWLYQKTVLNTRTDFVIINASLLFTSATVFIYFHMQKLNLIGTAVSVFWMLLLVYGNFKTQASRSLRGNLLSVVVVLEGPYLCYEVLVWLSKCWRSVMYKKERKQKVGRLRDSPKVEPIVSKDGEKPLAVGNEIPLPVGSGLPSASNAVPQVKPSSTFTGKGSKLLKKRKSPSTPDILEGHLDSMCIQRKSLTDFSPMKEGKDANHVVAALKYHATTITAANVQSNHRTSGQLLKPASFSVQKPSKSTGLFSGKHFSNNLPGDLLRPATLLTQSPNNTVRKTRRNSKSKDIDAFVSRMRICSESSDLPNEEKEELVIKEVVCEEMEPKATIWKRMRWGNTLICIFLFSVVCNLIFAYTLVYKVQKEEV